VRAFNPQPPCVGIALVLVVLLAGCGHSQLAPTDDILRVLVPTLPLHMDPRVSRDAGSERVHELIYDYLLTVDGGRNIVAGPPALAIQLDQLDPLTYIVQLRAGVRFHDGRELTARDVVYTFSTLPDPAVGRARALDDYRVEFSLAEPSDSFRSGLVMRIVPAGAGESLEAFPIGTGPYRFVQYTAGQQIELSAYEGYWDGLPQNAGITLRVVPDDAVRRQELRDGLADLSIDDAGVATAGAAIHGVRFAPWVSFGMMKDVRKRQPYGAARTRPSDRP
jgi:peptide/nickel transport system substrate-binding protein